MKRDELIKDLEFCESGMERLGDRSDIWQDRLVYGLLKVARDLLLDAISKQRRQAENDMKAYLEERRAKE